MKEIKFTQNNKKAMINGKLKKRVHHYADVDGVRYYGFYTDLIPYWFLSKPGISEDEEDEVGCIDYFNHAGITYILPNDNNFVYQGNKQIKPLSDEDLGMSDNGEDWNDKGETYGKV